MKLLKGQLTLCDKCGISIPHKCPFVRIYLANRQIPIDWKDEKKEGTLIARSGHWLPDLYEERLTNLELCEKCAFDLFKYLEYQVKIWCESCSKNSLP